MNEFFPDDAYAHLKTAYRAGREIDRLKGLLRFTQNRDGVFIARCAPDYDILSAFAEHFTGRFGEADWAIVDEKRNKVLMRQKKQAARLTRFDPNHPWFTDKGAGDPWEDLWKNYHTAVNNKTRANPKLQRQFMPNRYWKYLPEMDQGQKPQY
jgi:probable DNA metabolism protein